MTSGESPSDQPEHQGEPIVRRVVYVGIDPGKSGGIAETEYATGEGKITRRIGTYPTPIIPGKVRKILGGLKTEKVTKDAYDIDGMVLLLRDICAANIHHGKDVHVFVEHQQNMPPGVAKSAYTEFVLGYGYGLWIGILTGLRIKYNTVRPQDWHKDMFKGKYADTKEKSVQTAMAIWPGHDFRRTERSRKPWHGLTDAALIAEHGRRITESRRK